jgi:hypothetical protein
VHEEGKEEEEDDAEEEFADFGFKEDVTGPVDQSQLGEVTEPGDGGDKESAKEGEAGGGGDDGDHEDGVVAAGDAAGDADEEVRQQELEGDAEDSAAAGFKPGDAGFGNLEEGEGGEEFDAGVA